MKPLVLTDPNIQPTNELIFSIIGENSTYWEQLIEYLYENHLDIAEEWRFYNDGKCWLYKASRKKKTIYWIGIQQDTFRVSFWISEKAESIIEKSDLSESIKNEYRTAKRFKIGRCISIEMSTPEDFQNAIKLVEIKLKIK